MQVQMTSTQQKGGLRKMSLVVVPCVVLLQLLAHLGTHSTGGFKLNKVAAFCILVQWLVFVHASGIVFGNAPTERFYDLTGSLTFLLSSLWSGTFVESADRSLRQRILTACVQIWAVRLGTYLYSRIVKHGGSDSRFVEIKGNPPRFFVAWTLQGVWCFVTALPLLILNQAVDSNPLGMMDYIGIALWAVGFLLEVVADLQKSAFRSQDANRDKFIRQGLWSLSRHPNYFGEILCWLGLCLSCTQGMNFYPQQLVAFLSPTFVAFLLIHVSGIPLIEKSSDYRWGKMVEYQEYKLKTPVLIPFVGRRGCAPF